MARRNARLEIHALQDLGACACLCVCVFRSTQRRRSLHSVNPCPDPLPYQYRPITHILKNAGWYVRQGVHFGLFMGALAGQGSDEQRAEWLPKVCLLL